MTKRFMLNDYPWETVEKTKAFITRLYAGPAPDRPGCLMHVKPSEPVPKSPDGLGPREKAVWLAIETIRRTPLLGDTIPTLSTGAGTCAMATAFGCRETQVSDVYWVEPSIRHASDIDHLRKPKITDGKLGGILEQTRAYATLADERLSIRIMDFQSPFTTIEQMLGSELFFFMPHDEPARLKALMDIVTDFTIDFFKAQMEAAGPNVCPGFWPSFWFPKCAGIQIGDDNLVNVSPEVYEEFVLPYNNRIAEAFGGLFLHSCTIREPHLNVVARIKGLTGVNCDISTSVSPARQMERFGDQVVVAPHAYINTDTDFKNYTEFMRYVLNGWMPGRRLFIHPCSVLYMKATSKELPFSADDVFSVLREIPGWRRDHGEKRMAENCAATGSHIKQMKGTAPRTAMLTQI